MASKMKKVAKPKKAPAKKKVVGASMARQASRKASPSKTEKKTKKTTKKKSKKNIIPQSACNGFGPCCCCG